MTDTTAPPFCTASPAVAVTAATAGLSFSPPAGAGQGGYSSAVVVNSSPWIAELLCATGAVALQPYTADIVQVGGNQALILSMAVAPGGSATAPAGSLTFVQCLWYTAGGGDPPGNYPLALTSQAITAAIAGVLGVTTQQFTAVSEAPVLASPGITTFALNGFAYPTGLGAINFHSASITITPPGGGSAGQYQVSLLDENGIQTWKQVTPIAVYPNLPFTIGLPLSFGTLNGTCAIQIVNTTSVAASVDIILDQEPITPGVIIAGSISSIPVYDQGATIPPGNGITVPTGPTATASRLTSGVILAAPATGAWFLFGFNTAGNVAGGSVVVLTDGGTLDVAVGFDSLGANTGSVMCPLFGYRTTTAVTMGVFGNALSAGNLLYAPGP